MPGEDVEGVGAELLPIPPLDDVYHNKLLPVADNTDAEALWQYVTGDTTIGGDGRAVMVTSI